MRIGHFVVLAVATIGCASGSGVFVGDASDGEKPDRRGPIDPDKTGGPSYAVPPSASPLSRVTLGMNDAQVRNIMGDPDNANAYMTGKSWIPFYYGPDTHRTDWMYKGTGRVVYSRNRYSGSLKVIRIVYNPDETSGF